MIEIYLKQLIAELKAKKLRVTTAESCTGGAIATALTDKAGSSAWFDQGWVTYTDFSKHQQLGVAMDLMRETAVSQEVAEAMALGALQKANADLSIAVTGVAGPDGGNDTHPVGCCWFGFARKGKKITHQNLQLSQFENMERASLCIHHPPAMTLMSVCCYFSGNREEVRKSAVIFALQFALQLIRE